MRYAYIKNGDAVDQVRRLAPFDRPLDASGPDAFIGEFLRANSAQEILVLSRTDRRSIAAAVTPTRPDFPRGSLHDCPGSPGARSTRDRTEFRAASLATALRGSMESILNRPELLGG
jgi:hypothetical protein